MTPLDYEHLGRIVESPYTEGESELEGVSNMDKEVIIESKLALKREDFPNNTSRYVLPPWGSFTPPIPNPVQRPLSLAGFLGDIPDED